MKTYQTNKRGFTLVELLVVIVIIAALAGLTAPMVIRQRKKADQTEATSNARQIGFAMFEFESEFGSFPDDGTKATNDLVYTDTPIQGDNGSSNGYFKQLMQTGITQSETMFFAKCPVSKKPDGDISTDAAALAAGEVGFGYVTDGAGVGQSSGGNPARPLVVAPLASATEFDTSYFDKKAVVLRIDNSASSVPIVPVDPAAPGTGPAIVATVDMLDAANPIWGGSTDPVVNEPLAAP